MHRREAFGVLGAVAVGASIGRCDSPEPRDAGSSLSDVPAITVKELRAAIAKKGFQWSFIGKRLEFSATVISKDDHFTLRINGLQENKLDTAVLHNSSSKAFAIGEQLEVDGLIVDQWYGVWQIWQYTIARKEA